MKILVTGGAGYIGSHFAKAAKRAGHQPVVLDNLSTGHRELVKWGPLVHADLRDSAQVLKALRDYQIEAVVHFAAKALVGESMQRPELYYSNNVYGTLSLLQAMSEAEVRTLVFSSSCATYGLAKSDVMKEDHPQEPVNPYGRSKLYCERMIEDFATAHGLRYAMLRYFNVIGEDPEGETFEKHEPETHLVPNLIHALLAGHPFSMFGTDFPTPDGTAIRDYVDVNDLAQVHLAALEKLTKLPESFHSNIGSGRGYSVREVFGAVSEVFEQTPRVEEKPRRPGDPPRLVADPTYFRSWYHLPMKTLEESLRSMKKSRGSRR